MAGFLYFIPNVTPEEVTPELVRNVGLEPAFRDELKRWEPPHNVAIQRLAARGPDGGGSLLFVPGGVEPRTPGYNPQQQSWMKAGAYWIGFDTELKPTPDDLQRGKIVEGFPVVLHGNAEWIVPLVRSPFTTPLAHVPHVAALGSDGSLTTEIDPNYIDAWNASAVAWDVLIGNESLTFAEIVELCAKFLGVNYRIGLKECLALRLFTNENVRDVLMAVCNRSLLDEVSSKLKKKEEDQEPSNSTPGERDASPITDPADPPST